MMITKITNTPNYRSTVDLPQPKDYKLHDTPKPDPQPLTDTVSFTSKADNTKKVVDAAFKSLAKTRKGSNLGSYIGKIGNTNVYLKETELGKKADLTITRSNGYASYKLSRSIVEPEKITVAQDGVNSPNLVSIVKRYMKISK